MQSDDLFSEEEKQPLKPALTWWLKKLPLYNIILLIVGILIIIDQKIHYVEKFTIDDLITVMIFGIAANIFYSAGYLFEFALVKVLKSEKDFSRFRIYLFWLGVIFSIFVMAALAFLAEFLK